MNTIIAGPGSPPISAAGTSLVIREWTMSGPKWMHVHQSDDEAWHVLEGRLRFKLPDREVDATPGTTVFVPAGLAHTYLAVEPSRYLIILTPKIDRLITKLLGRSETCDLRSMLQRFDTVLAEEAGQRNTVKDPELETSMTIEAAKDLIPPNSRGHTVTIHTHTSATAAIEPATTGAEAAAIVAFWQEAGPEAWFAKDPAFDVAFRDRFAAGYCQAAQGALAHWTASPIGARALALLLDQHPRNAFRGTPWMYATDAMALLVAEQALALGHWDEAPAELRMFLLLPFGHSERLADQERSVRLAETFVPESADHARHHRDVVRTFGRFPHRNAILGRASTAEERAYLDGGGYAG